MIWSVHDSGVVTSRRNHIEAAQHLDDVGVLFG